MERPKLIQAFLLKQRHHIPELIKACDVNEKNSTGDSAIIFAASYGWINELELLLEAGADINAQDSETNTPMILVVGRKKQEAFHYLVSISEIEQLELFKEQLIRAHLDTTTFGLRDISRQMLDNALDVIEKATLEKRLQLNLEIKTGKKGSKI